VRDVHRAQRAREKPIKPIIQGDVAASQTLRAEHLEVIAAGLRSHLDAGADHVAIQVLAGNGNDPIPAYPATRSRAAVT
jgi:hypothetical protein